MRHARALLAASVLLAGATAAHPAAQAPANGGGPAAAKLPPPAIPAAFPYQVKKVTVANVQVAYLDEGRGEPVVFIHGNPTSKYLWRNIVPHVADRARAIALDLPGMGESGKPNPAPGFADQVRLFAAFVDALGLKHITLVGHDWGAAIAFDYARLHPGRVRAIAFMEGVLPPAFPQPSFEAMGPEMGGMFKAFKDPVQGRQLVIANHMFVEQILPGFVNRPLGDEEMRHYRRPYVDPRDREMLLAWPRQIPIAGEPADVVERMTAISAFMTSTDLPLLLLYAEPGVVMPAPAVEWYASHLRRVETVFVGQGLHFIQEDQPFAIGRALREWLRRLSPGGAR